jgi:hypothetical protein
MTGRVRHIFRSFLGSLGVNNGTDRSISFWQILGKLFGVSLEDDTGSYCEERRVTTQWYVEG